MITNSTNFLLLDKLSFFKVKLLLNDSKLSLKTKLQRIRCKFISLFYNKFRGNSNLVSGSNSTTRTALIYLQTYLVASFFLPSHSFYIQYMDKTLELHRQTYWTHFFKVQNNYGLLKFRNAYCDVGFPFQPYIRSSTRKIIMLFFKKRTSLVTRVTKRVTGCSRALQDGEVDHTPG